MARPKKDASESKSVMVNYTDYMNMQNWLANALQQQHAIASRIVAASNHQLSSINMSMATVQNNCRNTLQMSSIEEGSIDVNKHPAILQLLQTDTNLAQPVEALADMPLPVAPPMPKMKQKKQRKPKDPNAPKRPVTAFFLYLAENKDAMAKQLGPNAKPGEIQQKNKDMWNSLSDEKQDSYKAKYRENFEKYREQLREYAAQGGVVDPSLLNPDPVGTAAPAPEKEDEEPEDEVEAEESDEDENVEEEDDDDEQEEPEPAPAPAPAPAKKGKAAKAAAAKEAAPEKPAHKKKAAEEPKKKGKPAAATAEKSSSPEVPKKKRKAEAAPEPEPTAVDKKTKKKQRKSAGYGGNTVDY